MKVLLFAPPYPLEEFPSPPLGLCYAAAAFEAAGCEVRIIDYIVQRCSPEKIKRELDFFQPDIVGTNSVTMNYYAAVSILRTAKQHAPSIITMMGGPHVSFDYGDTLKNYPEIDIIVIGEGEQTIKEIVPVIHNPKSWVSVNGIAFIHEGQVEKTPERDFIRDLDLISNPPRHLLPLSKYLALGFPASIITSRGCPNRCIFCVGRRMVGSKFRFRSIPSIIDEIREIIEYGFEQINIADDFFTLNKKRVKEICREIKDRGLKFGWSVFARADSVDEETLVAMREAGCHTLLFGIESGNQDMLDRINKHIKVDQIKKAVSLCKQTGLKVLGSFIVGLPGETRESLMDSHRLIEELDVLSGYHFLAPFPGTIIKEQIDEYDLELLTSDWSKYDANQAIVRTSSLSAEDITWFVEQYYTLKVQADDDDLYRRFEAGQCSETDTLKVMGNRKMDVVYNLLSQDIIESLETFPRSNGQEISQLSDRISCLINRKPEIVTPAVLYMVNRGYLKKQGEKDRIRWRWA